MVFLLIFFAAAALRIQNLGSSPAGLFRDEVEKGYNAWALATGGGVIEFPSTPGERIAFRPLPYTIDVGSARTSAIYQYATAPFVGLLGLNPFTTRIVAALAGSLTVAALGLLLMRAWSPAAGLCAMFWLAACPWHWLFSRWALQGIFIPLGMVGVLAGLWGAERGRRNGFPLAGAALGFMVYAYSGAQPFALLWGLALAVLYRRELKAQPGRALLGVALFLALGGPRLWSLAFGGGGARLDAVAVWKAPDATILNTIGRFISGYVAHFSPKFLFWSGDDLARHAIPGHGQMTAIDALLLPLGAWAMFRPRTHSRAHPRSDDSIPASTHARTPLRGALALAFLIGPIGAAITTGHIPHGLRSLPMVLPAAACAGFGFHAAGRWLLGLFNSRGLGRRLALGALGAAAAVPFAVCARAIPFYATDPGARAAFQADATDAFRQAIAAREPYSMIWVNYLVANGYAPYYALYFAGIPPARAAEAGIERFGFVFYDPAQQSDIETQMAMQPGDIKISLAPTDMGVGGGILAKGSAYVWRKNSLEPPIRNNRPPPPPRRRP